MSIALDHESDSGSIDTNPREAPEPLSTAHLLSDQTRAGPLDPRAFLSLLAQHASNYWSARAAEFAISLTLIELFPGSLLPASIFGLALTATAVLFSRYCGKCVDYYSKLVVVRNAILVQKICAAIFYTALWFSLQIRAESGWWSLAVVCLAGCIHGLATTTIMVAIERDWAVCIARGSSENLTRLNVSLRRIDLLCKLASPLFVSFLTLISYPFAIAFLAMFDIVGMIFELLWIRVVYDRLPALAEEQARREGERWQTRQHDSGDIPKHGTGLGEYLRQSIAQFGSEWHEFAQLSIFFSSLAISALYFTVLSFDGVMLSYFKSHDWSDTFLAVMRALTVSAGLLGTLLMPVLEKVFGLVRAGSWSIWSEVVSLIAVVVAFVAVSPPEGDKGPAWANILIFSGMIASRVGLWSFDLAQTKQLQLALDEHPDRNALTAMQISLQNVANLLKYVLTIILSKPSQFRYAALASFGAVFCGAVLYSIYARRERGHLFHFDMAIEMLLRKRS